MRKGHKQALLLSLSLPFLARVTQHLRRYRLQAHQITRSRSGQEKVAGASGIYRELRRLRRIRVKKENLGGDLLSHP